MGLSLVELAIGKYPIPPPTAQEMALIFSDNAMEEHINAAKNGMPLPGNGIHVIDVRCCALMYSFLCFVRFVF